MAVKTVGLTQKQIDDSSINAGFDHPNFTKVEFEVIAPAFNEKRKQGFFILKVGRPQIVAGAGDIDNAVDVEERKGFWKMNADKTLSPNAADFRISTNPLKFTHKN